MAGPGAIRTKPSRTVAAAAPGLGGGKEALVFSAGALVLYVLCVALRRPVCHYFRRISRYFGRIRRHFGHILHDLRTKVGWVSNGEQDSTNRHYRRNNGRG